MEKDHAKDMKLKKMSYKVKLKDAQLRNMGYSYRDDDGTLYDSYSTDSECEILEQDRTKVGKRKLRKRRYKGETVTS